jgi:hypothetical protein
MQSVVLRHDGKERRVLPKPLVARREARTTLRALLGSVVLTACGVAVTVYAASTWGSVGIAAAAVLGLCSLFFATASFYLLHRLISTRPMLVVDAQGILDHTTPFSVGRLRWDEVADVKVRDDTSPSFVSVDVTDPQRLVARQGAIRRFVIRLTARRWGVVVINSGAVDVAPDRVVQAIREWMGNEGSGRT